MHYFFTGTDTQFIFFKLKCLTFRNILSVDASMCFFFPFFLHRIELTTFKQHVPFNNIMFSL